MTFDYKEKRILTEELNKLMIDWLDYLEDNDNDEAARHRLHTISKLKNLIHTDQIDKLTWDESDDDIYTVDVDRS